MRRGLALSWTVVRFKAVFRGSPGVGVGVNSAITVQLQCDYSAITVRLQCDYGNGLLTDHRNGCPSVKANREA
jgi:hypothetical protein